MVQGSAPLLISRPALKRLGASLDFNTDQLTLFQGQVRAPLLVSSASQYVIDVMQFPQKPKRDVSDSSLKTADVDECLLSETSHVVEKP